MPRISYSPLRPYLPPYDPRTKPWYLDQFWTYFRGRPFALNGSYGFTGSQGTATLTLASTAAQAATTLVLTTGGGANFTPGESIVVGDGAYSWQSFTITSIATDTLTVAPKVLPAAGWPSGSKVVGTFGNDTHPANTFPYTAWAQSIVDAKQGRSPAGGNLLGVSSGHNIGDMETQYTDTNGIANVPVGWVSVQPATVNQFLRSSYDPAQLHPNARTTNGAFFSTTAGDTTGGTGMELVTAIPVKAGETYTLLAHAKVTSGGATLYLVDSDSGATLNSIGLGGVPAQGSYTNSLCTPVYLITQIPSGTANVKIRLLSSQASAGVYMDYVRLHPSRQDAAYDRYVIEDPQNRPIVLLGDSWGAGTGGTKLIASLQNRLGTGFSIINSCISGQKLTDMIARMSTDVLPYKPAYCIHTSGWMNDLVANRTSLQLQGDIDTFIDTCRTNGIIPVIPGVAPSSNTSITGGLQTCHDLNDTMRTRCTRFTL